jgi:general secretion pathway protein J
VNRTNSENRGESGVTLVETLVALFVIALMASAGAVMTTQSLAGARAVETRGDKAAELSTALSMISADLGALMIRPSQDANQSEPPYVFQGYAPRYDGRIMVFVRNGWPNPQDELRSDLQRVEYLLESGSLIRRSWAAADPAQSTKTVDQVLLEGIETLEVRFGRADTWQSEWVVPVAESPTLPQKTELTFRFSKDDTLSARFLIGAGS